VRVGILLFVRQQLVPALGFPRHQPRVQAVVEKALVLLLERSEGRARRIAELVRREAEPIGDLADFELARLQELRVLVRHLEDVELHSLFEDCNLVLVLEVARVQVLPRLAQSL
jgi:hypothetical protein